MTTKTPKHGGHRVGAGRPPKWSEASLCVGTQLPVSAVAWIDDHRKPGESRSAAVGDLVLKALRKQGWKL